MQKFIHRKNLELYRKRLLEATDPAKRDVLVRLLTEEESKDLEQPAEPRAPAPE